MRRPAIDKSEHVAAKSSGAGAAVLLVMTSRPKAIPRTEYLIDRYHVIFESGAGWHCVCAEFTLAGDCRHARESQGRHAAQAVIANRLLHPRSHLALL